MYCNKCCTFRHHNPVSEDWLWGTQASRPKFGVVTVSLAFVLALIKLPYELLEGELDLILGNFTFLNERGLKAVGFPKWVEKSRGKRPHISSLRLLLSVSRFTVGRAPSFWLVYPGVVNKIHRLLQPRVRGQLLQDGTQFRDSLVFDYKPMLFSLSHPCN